MKSLDNLLEQHELTHGNLLRKNLASLQSDNGEVFFRESSCNGMNTKKPTNSVSLKDIVN